MLYQNLSIIRPYVSVLHENKDEIVRLWLGCETVKDILKTHDIDIGFFAQEYAFSVLEYFIEVINESQKLGECPVIVRLINFFKEKKITSAQLYDICSAFRSSVTELFIKNGQSNMQFFQAMHAVFDKNFHGVLKSYTYTVCEAKKSAEYFQTIVENSINEIYVSNKETMHFIYVNKSARENLGYKQEELLSMLPQDIDKNTHIDEIERIREFVMSNSGGVYSFETRHQRKDGTFYDIELKVENMQIGSDDSILIADVTII